MDETVLREAIDEWLAAEPLSIGELAVRAVQAGLISPDVDDDGVGPEDQIEWLLDHTDAYWSTRSDTDHKVFVVARSFTDSGMTFIHRVTAAELAAGAVDEMPDLSIVLWNCRGGLPLDDGSGTVDTDYSELAAPKLAGPLDWLEAVQPGDLLAFTRTDGVLSVEIVDEAELGDGEPEMVALADAAPLWIGDGGGSEEVPVVMEALARDPQLFRSPVPPVGELLEAIGLECRGHEWGWADEDWRTRREVFEEGDAAIRRLYGFDRCCDQAYERVEAAWHEHLSGGAADGGTLAEDLGHGSVSRAFAHVHASTPTQLVGFASALAETATGRHAAPALTLLGLAHLRSPDPVQAYAALTEAVRTDAHFPEAAETLALLELDRGNLSRAHSLALRDEVDPALAEWIDTERERQHSLRPTAARNDPCPCGSGKKFKRCCAAGGALPLTQRLPFVLQRMSHYATGPDGHGTIFGLALSAAGGHADVVDALSRFVDEPFFVDLAVHEGGLGEQYVDERGPLLADDEVALLEELLYEPPRLWEVTEVQPGATLTLRDTGSGDVLTVTERSGSTGRDPGEFLLARATVVEGHPMLFGVSLLVPLRQRDRVMRLLDDGVDADGLAMWFGSLFLPPRLTNREGEELVLRRTLCRFRNPTDEVVAALDEAFERHGDGLVWHEMFDLDGHDRVVRGTLRIDGPLLAVESNSEERQERLLAALDEMVEYAIVEDGEVDHADPGEAVTGTTGLSDPDAMSDELRGFAEQHIRAYEERWVDESVPALGGLTPRQALVDPTRREDLLALLREMRLLELPEGAAAMSAERVERLLGVEQHGE
ncbi:MAG: SEC-C domain-containing protein [Acidimicrobiia bacterium]|nr:SEC-C domain-containing protein [Acidimicrobiia bacterium]